MSETHLTIIVAHSNLAKALLNSVEKILGKQEDTFVYSNEHDSMAVLVEKIEKQIGNSRPETIICFTDLRGGSCWTLAGLIKRRYPQMTVISGVNLPMLTTYFNNRTRLELPELIEKTLADGCRGITRLQD